MYVPGAYAGEGEGGREGGHAADISMKGVHLGNPAYVEKESDHTDTT